MKIWIGRVAARAMLLALASAVPAQAQDDLESTLVKIEKSLWEAWKGGDADVFEARLVENAVHTGAGGVTVGRAQMIEGMQEAECEVESFSLSDFRVQRVGSGTAILTYRAEQTATCAEETLPTPVWSSAVYVNRDGGWMNAFYQETPAREN